MPIGSYDGKYEWIIYSRYEYEYPKWGRLDSRKDEIKIRAFGRTFWYTRLPHKYPPSEKVVWQPVKDFIAHMQNPDRKRFA